MKVRQLTIMLLVPIFLCSCGSRRSLVQGNSKDNPSSIPGRTPAIKHAIAQTALQFLGTAYQYGGTTKEGMDCSGLIYNAFGKNGIPLPRVSSQMAILGEELKPNQVQSADLLFFNTGKKRKGINHVGLVIRNTDNEITFIHATTSKGVIVSSLAEDYWQRHFVMAKRLLSNSLLQSK